MMNVVTPARCAMAASIASANMALRRSREASAAALSAAKPARFAAWMPLRSTRYSNAYRQCVAADVRPPFFIGLGEAAPRGAVKFSGLHSDFHVGPRNGHGNEAAGEELASRRHAEDAQTVHVGETADRVLNGEEVQRVPSAGRRAPTRDGHTSTKLNPILAFCAQTLKADPSTPLHA